MHLMLHLAFIVQNELQEGTKIMQYIVQEAAYAVLKDYPEGLTVRQITDEILKRKLYMFSAQKPEEIVARALNRHCKRCGQELFMPREIFFYI